MKSMLYTGSPCAFKPAPEPQSEPQVEARGRYFYVIEGIDKALKISHATESEARAEAERLAKAHNKTVRLLRVVASVNIKQTIEYTPIWYNE